MVSHLLLDYASIRTYRDLHVFHSHITKNSYFSLPARLLDLPYTPRLSYTAILSRTIGDQGWLRQLQLLRCSRGVSLWRRIRIVGAQDTNRELGHVEVEFPDQR